MDESAYLLVIISCIPVIIMCAYIYNKDKDKEPARILRKLFLCGIFSIVPIVILELIADKVMIVDNNNLVSLFINVFIGVGLIEEGAKWVIVNKAVYFDKEFNHAYDAIIYCVFTSLGFALIENLLYVFDSGSLIGIFRGITTIPLHTFTGVVMGYFLGKAKQADINNNEKEAKKYMFYSLIVPIICHTFYDFLIFAQRFAAVVLFFIFVLATYIISIILVRKISFVKKNFDGSSLKSKMKKTFSSESDLFEDTLFKTLVVSLSLIIVSSYLILF